VVEEALAGVDDEVVGKVLQHTATALYQLDAPQGRP
jgi:hypothetical protein